MNTVEQHGHTQQGESMNTVEQHGHTQQGEAMNTVEQHGHTQQGESMNTVEHQGLTFKIELVPDYDMGPPWKECDGHGPVSEWTRRGKRPGELILDQDHGDRLYYDFQGAVRQARKEGWDAPPYGQGTPGERAVRAARADFDYLRRWCEGQWWYVGVVVTLLDDDGDETDYERSLWGIEDGYLGPYGDPKDYQMEIVKELADEIIHDYQRMGA